MSDQVCEIYYCAVLILLKMSIVPLIFVFILPFYFQNTCEALMFHISLNFITFPMEYVCKILLFRTLAKVLIFSKLFRIFVFEFRKTNQFLLNCSKNLEIFLETSKVSIHHILDYFSNHFNYTFYLLPRKIS